MVFMILKYGFNLFALISKAFYYNVISGRQVLMQLTIITGILE